MQIFHTVKELRNWRKSITGSVALVPTMGNLHEGHLSLVAQARQAAEHVVVSIFVNRIQFSQGEDFDQYPRTLQQDAEKLRAAGVAAVFAPDERELYPAGEQSYFVEPPALKHELCGATRPIHFRGVATVVSKLFNLVQPDVACFGKKDYQQLVILQGMVRELNFPVRIIPVEIGRAADGLALSSRNQYLSATERTEAPYLQQVLQQTVRQAQNGTDYAACTTEARAKLQAHGWAVDYVEIREAGSLKTAQAGDKNLVVLAAAKLGSTRLIDNIVFAV